MPDFFVSYTSADRAWAEWIAFVLEEAGFSTVIQAWDFRPGSNFVLEMQKASEADRTIMVLSPDYLKSQFTSPEWAAAFAQDSQGIDRKLLPIVVRKCNVPGLLRSVVHIDLSALDEDSARQQLLDGTNAKRAKPSKRPKFPGAEAPALRKPFPGSASEVHRSTYIPDLKKQSTDVDRRRFSQAAFDTIRAYFRNGLNELADHSDAIECDFQSSSMTGFSAEVFLHGKSACRCRLWLGGLSSPDGISYAEGQAHFGTNACNEILSISEAGGALYLEALFGTSTAQFAETLNPKRMDAGQAADYLWRRFVKPLER
ncbi:toll/interleukin-1 receptor domain-containing protein [Bradyrhizobium sp. Arg816]|uniref:toll/interleukin-1 receptor domain-containing protein n=1 Tax=Bradyrhizobium sp. Arg816 TaxID=2998491 RepID=UPI00249F3922|nr:toll/interleukin-1 receptor domain-containing protein [Bradyrhizobium sp. Arg816]MDI3563457.1 toll/interleukin-1 receptor domain-containing protein [Bradyrhizobium sp. Arg816]